MKVRIIVPRRADRGDRDRLWTYCRNHWETELPEAEIVEGHHDAGPFNRSAAINAAARGDWDVAVILDADVVLAADQVRAAIDRARATDRNVVAFSRRRLLSRPGTLKILAGYRGSWSSFVAGTQRTNVSTCVVVTRALFDDVGGFDERFVGWGGEDNAFSDACRALRGRIERLDGDAWHLWHRASPWRDHRLPEYVQAKALADRYAEASLSARRMRLLLAEGRGPDQVVVIVLTTGTRDTLEKTLQSAEQMISGPIGRRVVVLDSGRSTVLDRVRRAAPGWDVVRIKAGRYDRAVAGAREVALRSGQPWVFWIEDDFVFEVPVELERLEGLMTAKPALVQVSLLRQAWYPDEVAAGGIIDAKPNAFRQAEGYVAHRDYWTMNPHLARRSFWAGHEWPKGPGSERRFGLELFRDPRIGVGIFGELDDPPRVTHIGETHAGTGY